MRMRLDIVMFTPQCVSVVIIRWENEILLRINEYVPNPEGQNATSAIGVTGGDICQLSKRIRDPGLDLDAASGHILYTLFKVRGQHWPS